jgi:pyridoxamine 5'-phosphate oxidase
MALESGISPDPRLMAGDFVDRTDPFDLFGEWLDEATRQEINDPTAMALATVDEMGLPNVRMVLLKGFDEAGFVFYTNLESTKGRELAANPKAALCFHWKSLRRQVRVRGLVESVSREDADVYFATRPRGAQVGAWASRQSRPLDRRETLESAVAEIEARFGEGDVTRPEHWGGLRVMPLEIEFWHERLFRLHDRIVFRRRGSVGGWSKERLYP